jgi:hypothetical protein
MPAVLQQHQPDESCDEGGEGEKWGLRLLGFGGTSIIQTFPNKGVPISILLKLFGLTTTSPSERFALSAVWQYYSCQMARLLS